MTLLTNKTKVSALLQVAIGIEDSEFEKYIEEAQKFDLKPLVCEAFFYDLLAKKDEEPWKKLVDGGTYEFDGRDYEFDGIAGVVAYFAYANFYLNSSAVSTSFGIVTKNNPQSTPVSLEERKNVHYKKRQYANSIMEDVVRFIERNISDYESYKCDSGCSPEKKGGFSTRVLDL
ncbi:DUF6712 family protein [Flavobacterium sp.]